MNTVYQFNATNHAGLRLSWFFDVEEEARAAHRLATKHRASQPSMLAMCDRASVPGEELIADSSEFERWLVGGA